MNEDEFYYIKLFKIEIQDEGPSNSDFLQNWFPPEIRSPLFNLKKFQNSDKGSSESCRSHWNLMNDKKFSSLKVLELKYRRRDQIFLTLYKVGSLQKLDP